MENADSTDSSFESQYGVEEDVERGFREFMQQRMLQTFNPSTSFETTSSGETSHTPQSINSGIPYNYTTQLQDLVMCALMQSTSSLFAPPTPVMVGRHEGSVTTPGTQSSGPAEGSMSMVGAIVGGPSHGSVSPAVLAIEGVQSPKLWNEASYNLVEARQKRKPVVTRTSAGEGSDSQEDYPIPESETSQQRSLRTRRLNRFRTRRAKELTNNRKALKKLPHVIFVDGTAKAKGIHRHLWRAAVRGQCRRLDPTKDNINHHPKHVIDSIWHALEKEWEFEGFVHRAREMFERAATKFMRNRKMQLKYKCMKNIDGGKSGDVSPAHWAKIVDLTMKSAKQSAPLPYIGSSSKGKEEASTSDEEKSDTVFQQLGLGNDEEMWNAKDHVVVTDVSVVEDEVEAKIRSLQTELSRLQNSRKDGSAREGRSGTASANTTAVVIAAADGVVLKEMSANIVPLQGKGQGVSGVTLGSTQMNVSSIKLEKGVQHEVEPQLKDDRIDLEMDCGDLVRLFAFSGGRKEEIGKGIVMGLAGTKYTRKEIPERWKSIKLTSYTSSGSSKICPFPPGWVEQLKAKTVEEMNGKTILWPDMLLRSL